MPGTHLDLDLATNLGGDNPSDVYIASQKATKTYVDGEIDTVNEKIDAIQVVDELRELQDVTITDIQNGNALVYNSTTQKWENSTISTQSNWGSIGGTLANQTDLKNALDAKANSTHTHTVSQITDLTIPTKTSELTNDSGFITTSALSGYAKTTDIPENVSDLTNDAGYITNAAIPTKLSSFTDDLGSTPTHTHSQYLTSHQSLENYATKDELPTKVSELTNDSGYLTSADISSVFVYQGTKENIEQLPTTGNKKGDVWTVSTDGAEYVWTGTAWEYLGEILDLSGYQTLITSTNKLSADLLSEGTTNKLVSQTEKNTWNNKQDAINDLDDIRSGAALGATAIQDISGKQDKITSDNKLSSDLVDDTNKTNKFVTEAEKTTWNAKQNAISDLDDIRSGATAGSTAVQPAAISDMATKTWVGEQNYLTEHQDISGKQDVITTSNKLSADLVKDGTTNKVVTQTEKDTWNAKQDAISDLTDIRSKANSALQSIPSEYITETELADYDYATNTTVTTGLGQKQNTITSSNKLSADLISDGTTNKTVTAAEKNTWNAKQNAITESNKLDATLVDGLATVATSGSYNDLDNKPTIPTVNDGKLTIQKNGTQVGTFTANQSTTSTINITVPTTAADVNALPSSTKYASSIDLSMDADTYVISIQLKDQDGNNLGTAQTVDLPLESVVVSGSYNQSTKKVVLTLKDGSTVEFSIADLISGLQSEITTTNKLSADLIQDGTTNKVVTATEKTTWNGKQDAISDLATIRSNATAGKSASDTISGYGDIVTHNASEFQAAGSYVPTSRKVNGKALTTDITLSASDVNALPADTEIPTNVSDLNNDSGFITGISSSDVTTALGYTPYDSTNPNGYTNNVGTITGIKMNGASKGTSGVVDLGTVITAHQDISGKQDKITTTNKLDASLISGLGAVATSNSYNDLDDKPSIPVEVTESTVTGWGFTKNTGTITSIKMNGTVVGTSGAIDLGTVITDISGKQDKITTTNKLTASLVSGLATVATSGSYTDLSNKPTIPTVVDTYSATGTDAVSGKAIKAALDSISDNDTKNTAGTTNKAATKLFIIGAESQADNPQTYSNINCYVGTDNCLYSNGVKVLTAHQSLSGYVPTSRTINSKALTANITLSASDVGALASISSSDVTTALGYTPYDATNPNGYTSNVGTITGIKMNGASKGTSGVVDLGTVITDVSGKLDKTNVTSKGSATQPVYFDANGVATACTYTLSASVPADAKFSDTTYSAGTGLSLSGTTINHTDSITSGTVGTSTATSGSTLAVPYVTYNSSGHITAVGTHTHTISGFAASSHNQASNTINAMTGYSIATSGAAITATDSLNTAIGKLEFKVNNASSGGSVKVSQLTTNNRLTATTATATVYVDKTNNKITIFGNTYATGANAFATAVLAGQSATGYVEVTITTHSEVKCLQYGSTYYNKSTFATVA